MFVYPLYGLNINLHFWSSFYNCGKVSFLQDDKTQVGVIFIFGFPITIAPFAAVSGMNLIQAGKVIIK